MPQNLTRHQQEIMNVIMIELKSGKPFPTLRRIAELLGKNNTGTTNGIRNSLNVIAERGHLKKVGCKWVLPEDQSRERLLAILLDLVRWNRIVTKSGDGVWVEAVRACTSFT